MYIFYITLQHKIYIFYITFQYKIYIFYSYTITQNKHILRQYCAFCQRIVSNWLSTSHRKTLTTISKHTIRQTSTNLKIQLVTDINCCDSLWAGFV